MFEQEPEEFVEHDNYISIGPFGGDAGFIATREIQAGESLDAGYEFSQNVNRSFVLVVTVTQ